MLCFQVGPDEICGCPAAKDLFTDTTNLCRNAKRKCHKHVCWEKFRRGQIDLERLRQVCLSDLNNDEYCLVYNFTSW